MANSAPAFPEAKAKELLLSYLDDEQQRTYKADGFFYMRGRTGQIYALHDGAYACWINDEGRIARRRGCFPYVPPYPGHRGSSALPLPDRLLGQMLLLETNEEYFLSHACNQPPPARFENYPANLLSGRHYQAFLKHSRPKRLPPRPRPRISPNPCNLLIDDHYPGPPRMPGTYVEFTIAIDPAWPRVDGLFGGR